MKQLKSLVIVFTLLLSTVGFAATLKQVKAVYLFNFTNFVTWPSHTFANKNSPIQICLVGNDGLATPLRKAVRGEYAQGRSIKVKLLNSVTQISGCHIVYAASSANASKVINAAKQKNILTVANGASFADRGGVIGFTSQSGKIKLEINLAAAKRQKLKISSKLLRLAKVI